MEIVNLETGRLAAYCKEQLRRLVPFGDETDFDLIDIHLSEALARLDHCISAVRIWKPGSFDVLHSSQYCTFLYYLSNTIWRAERAVTLCTKLFLLNKQINAIDMFYEIEMPEVFLIGHSVGIVLSKATYGNYFMIHQNCTVGKNNGIAPVIENGVILFPNSAVIGKSLVRQRTVVAQGVSVIDRDTQAHLIAFQGPENSLVFKRDKRDILSDFFRNF
ncbi:hypothetical protein [Mesorhizobium sp. CAU 1741]|uniref:hypothetical protein n=1 Tax=Mesorhizobium sp. CAU 1741 TaxID=3140366 RepID=UPI00325B8E13